MRLNNIELKGERVKLIPMSEEHASALYEAGKEEKVWDYMPRKVSNYKDMQALVKEALKDKENESSLPFVIVDLQTKQVVGSTRFTHIEMGHRHLEIGWTWLNPAVWGTRVNTECKYLLLKYCFEELKLVRVQLKADARNRRSLQAIERIGAKKEGVLRKERILPDGFIRDAVYYSIIQEEWDEISSQLKSYLSKIYT
ncbi:GNAT family N-acetyltransferase [Chengkuizengella axinellae]|uniref:GNAT family protein n=1 Tax=Chengkuizengella axinellae TaxID=3064388 RepID=A0ABT9J4F8_9BACL|nr:GNAT family protein [Chengkuizengella sp. 2205SS18-9]MDP5275865.1 GNAT family protein [Chengkuizengella sp. 2205SS18-9]